MEGLLLNKQLRLMLQSLLNDPPHALLLIGASGLGKFTIAENWAKQLTPFVEILQPDDKGTISIDSVRNLYGQTRSKRTDRQIIIVDHAESMSTEAQNAFLKLLEEPRPGVTFVLTAPSTDALLATITSRTQNLQIQPMLTKELKAWAESLDHKLSQQELSQLLFVAQGRPGILKTLLTQKSEFDKYKQIMQTAKSLLECNKYQRLSAINKLLKDKDILISTLEAMMQMLKLQIQRKPEVRWLKMADGLQECLVRLSQNANPRAQLLRLFMLF